MYGLHVSLWNFYHQLANIEKYVLGYAVLYS